MPAGAAAVPGVRGDSLGGAATEGLRLAPPARDSQWKEFSEKGFCLRYSLCPLLLLLLSSLCRDRVRAGSEEASPDSLEIPTPPKLRGL